MDAMGAETRHSTRQSGILSPLAGNTLFATHGSSVRGGRGWLAHPKGGCMQRLAGEFVLRQTNKPEDQATSCCSAPLAAPCGLFSCNQAICRGCKQATACVLRLTFGIVISQWALFAQQAASCRFMRSGWQDLLLGQPPPPCKLQATREPRDQRDVALFPWSCRRRRRHAVARMEGLPAGRAQRTLLKCGAVLKSARERRGGGMARCGREGVAGKAEREGARCADR